MARKRIEEGKTPEEVLRYVLANWRLFCDRNNGLAWAIAEMLNENARLKKKLEIIDKISGGTTPNDKSGLK